MATESELRARLEEAEKLYHEIQLHGAVRTLVDQSGERIEYSPTNAARLRNYILELKAKLGMPLPVSGPLGFWF